MAITAEQYTAILTRLTRIENMLNDVAVALDKFVTISDINQLHTLIQQEQEDIRTLVEALDNRVTSIEEEPLT